MESLQKLQNHHHYQPFQKPAWIFSFYYKPEHSTQRGLTTSSCQTAGRAASCRNTFTCFAGLQPPSDVCGQNLRYVISVCRNITENKKMEGYLCTCIDTHKHKSSQEPSTSSQLGSKFSTETSSSIKATPALGAFSPLDSSGCWDVPPTALGAGGQQHAAPARGAAGDAALPSLYRRGQGMPLPFRPCS